MEIHTQRLLMREFRAEDWPAVLAYQSNPLYLRYYDWTRRTQAEVQEFIGHFLRQQEQQPRTRFQFALELKSSGELIGNCGIRMADPGAHEADIGYELDPRHWGKGYATEAARAILRFGFTELHLHRVWSWCVADNTGSSHVLEKLGMHQEGRLRDKEYYKGRFWDTLMYGILEQEYFASL